MYPDPIEQAKKLALTGMAGALTNIMALVLGVSSSLHLGGGTSGLSAEAVADNLLGTAKSRVWTPVVFSFS